VVLITSPNDEPEGFVCCSLFFIDWRDILSEAIQKAIDAAKKIKLSKTS
jgi:hypothetical protein